jgi:hypothetical protein
LCPSAWIVLKWVAEGECSERRRLIGASGFQLINVNNVPLSLRGWSVDTRLIGRKALRNSLMRHYIAQAISEAHKARYFSIVCCIHASCVSL